MNNNKFLSSHLWLRQYRLIVSQPDKNKISLLNAPANVRLFSFLFLWFCLCFTPLWLDSWQTTIANVLFIQSFQLFPTQGDTCVCGIFLFPQAGPEMENLLLNILRLSVLLHCFNLPSVLSSPSVSSFLITVCYFTHYTFFPIFLFLIYSLNNLFFLICPLPLFSSPTRPPHLTLLFKLHVSHAPQ